ncbi:MAG: hypothetical protein P4N24_02075 [Acidobacteriota bacterium]|nr:hypothetical protein [Acidobacteriota bacterium]
MKEPDIEPDSLSQQIYIGLAQIRDEACPGARLKDSQTSHNGKTGICRNTTGFPLIQQNDIGWETLGQQNSAALTGTKVAACMLERRVRQGPLRCDFDPVCLPYLFGARKTTTRHCYFMLNLDRDQNPFVNGGEKIQSANPGEGNQGR